jgi:hypothetical protein
MDARKNPAISLRKPEWGQDNQQLPHKASILQVLDWRVGNTTNKAHDHFFVFFVFLFSLRFIYFYLYLFMSMCSLTILQHVLIFVNPTYFI